VENMHTWNRRTQGCPWVGLTHGLGWVGRGSEMADLQKSDVVYITT